MATGAITPYLRIPSPDNEMTDELPARRVRLLAEQPGAAPEPVPMFAPTVTEPQAPRSVPEQATVAPSLTSRQKAAKSGVLAMRDELAELQGTKPRVGTMSRQEEVSGQVHSATTQPSMLIANVTRGSQGIEGGVAHQSVLGSSGLPDREGGRQGTRGQDEGVVSRGSTSRPSKGGVGRSEEEIQEVLDRNKGAMYTLYNRELRKDATLQGKLVMSITIAPAGHVTRCVILSSELDSASLEGQLVALIKRIDFGNKPDVPAVTTKVPIEFFPR